MACTGGGSPLTRFCPLRVPGEAGGWVGARGGLELNAPQTCIWAESWEARGAREGRGVAIQKLQPRGRRQGFQELPHRPDPEHPKAGHFTDASQVPHP